MADKLEIGVEADTDDAKSGLDDLSKTLDEVGDAAEKAGASAGKSAFQWQTQAETMGRVGIAAKPAAAGMKEVAAATITASQATAIAQTRFQKLATTLATFGRTAVRGIKTAFSGLVTAMAAIGRAAGRALMLAFIAGLGLLATAVILFSKMLNKLINAAGEAGEKAAQALTDAFGAGLSLEHLTELQGALAGILPDPDDAREAAKALGELNAQLRIGGEEGDRAQAAAKLLGINLANLTKGGKAAFDELVKLQGIYQAMDQIQQRDLLRLLFPEASDDVLSQVDAALEGTKENLIAMGTEAATAGGKIAAEIEKMRQYGEAAASASDAWDRLLETVQRTTGVDFSWEAISAEMMRGVAAALDSLSASVEAMGRSFEKVKTAVIDFATAIGDLASAGWDAIVSGINSVISAVNSMITALQSAWEWLQKLGNAEIDIPFPGAPQGSPLLAPQRFAGLLAPSDGGAGLRAAQAGAAQQSNLVGRAVPRAANDNVVFGPGTSKQLDDILWRWKEVSKEAKKAGDAVAASAAQQVAALTTVNEQLDVNLLAQRLTNQELVDWAAGVLQASDGTFEFRAALAQLDEAMKRGIISSDQYGVALKQLQADLAGDGNIVQNLTEDLISFGESAADAFLDAAFEGENFSDVIRGLVKDLAKLIIKALIIQPLLDSISSALGGVTGAAAAPAGVPLAALAASQSGLGRAGDSLSTMSSNIAGRKNRATGADIGNSYVQNNLGDIAIDMSQTGTVAASSDDARKFGLMVRRSVEGIMVEQSRPGGLLRKVA